MSYCKVIILGNLTRDPELKYTPKGTAVAKLGIAVSRKWKSESGEQKEEVTFLDVEAWGRQAEVVAQYFKKGSSIFVDGRLKLDTWEDKNTKQKMSKLKVVLESFSFTSGKGESQQAAPASEPQQQSQQPAEAPAAPAAPAATDECPF